VAIVSVIIPCYNGERTLRETVASAGAQTLPDIEIIIVNDGSTDTSGQLAESLQQHDRRIAVHTITNRKLPGARNYGIEQASGRYIAPLDADDLWHPTYLEKLVNELERVGENSAFAYSFLRRIDENGNIIETKPSIAINGNALQRSIAHNFVGTGSGIVIRRSAAVAIGGYDERVRGSEDYLMQIKLAAVGEVVCVPEYLIGYRQTATSMSISRFAMARGSLEALDIAVSEVEGINPSVARWAMARTQIHGVIQAAKSYRFGLAFGLAFKGLYNDFVGFIADGFERGRRRYGRPHAVSASEPPRHFNDIDPTADFVELSKTFRRKRLERASRLEAGSPSASSFYRTSSATSARRPLIKGR